MRIIVLCANKLILVVCSQLSIVLIVFRFHSRWIYRVDNQKIQSMSEMTKMNQINWKSFPILIQWRPITCIRVWTSTRSHITITYGVPKKNQVWSQLTDKASKKGSESNHRVTTKVCVFNYQELILLVVEIVPFTSRHYVNLLQH